MESDIVSYKMLSGWRLYILCYRDANPLCTWHCIKASFTQPNYVYNISFPSLHQHCFIGIHRLGVRRMVCCTALSLTIAEVGGPINVNSSGILHQEPLALKLIVLI